MKRSDGGGSWQVHGTLILVQLFFGLNYLAAKVVLREIPPPAWAVIRVWSAALLLLAVARLTGRSLSLPRGDIARLAFYSLFGVVINQWLFVEGLARTSPTHASILMTGIPLATLLFALALRREALVPARVLALGLGLLGVVLVIGRGSGAGAVEATLAGDILILVNATSYSFFLVISKRLLDRVDPLVATAILLSFGALGMLVPGLSSVAALDPRTISDGTWALAAFIVIFPTAAAYLMTTWALSRVESSVVALFIYLQPLIASGLSIAFLGDRIAPREILGAVLVFASVYLALRRPGRARPRSG